VVAVPAITAYASAPHYALYSNVIGNRYTAHFFPHDEFYDDGLREGIRFVCESAPNGATMAHETPGVAGYYLTSFGRQDLKSETISSREFDVRSAGGPVYVIVQRGRTYFENRDELEYVRANFQRIHEVKINGATAVEVFVNQPQ